LCFCYPSENKSSKPKFGLYERPRWGECGPVRKAKRGRGGGERGV
jgi:hypothetical protein